MGTPQSELAEHLASLLDLQVLKFRHYDAVIFQDAEILKLFVPRSVRALGGSAEHRRIEGDIEFVRRQSLVKLRAPSEKYEQPQDSFGRPIFNFPWLIRYPRCIGDKPDRKFFSALTSVFNVLPDDQEGWCEQFGTNFFDLGGLDKLSLIVAHLRHLRPGSSQEDEAN